MAKVDNWGNNQFPHSVGNPFLRKEKVRVPLETEEIKANLALFLYLGLTKSYQI